MHDRDVGIARRAENERRMPVMKLEALARTRATWLGVTFAAVALGGGLAAPAGALENTFETGPGGVVIPVRLTERITSQEATTGQSFGFETTGAVDVDGVHVKARTPGVGVVVYARSGRGPEPGKLRLAATELHLAGGKSLPVGFEESEAGTVSAADSAHAAGLSVPSSIGTVVVGGITRGNNVVYEKGSRFTVLAPPPATPVPDPQAT